MSKDKPETDKPLTVKGGAEVVEFDPDSVPQQKEREEKRKLKKTNIRIKKKNNKEKELKTSKEFVQMYKDQIKVYSWNPKDLRKCGKKSKEILASLGCKFKNDNIPFKVQQERRQQNVDKGLIPDRRF